MTRIGRHTFTGSGITSIEIPNSVTKIEEYAFSGCSSLKSIHIPVSVKVIDKYAFLKCEALEEIYVEWSKPISIDKSVFDYNPSGNILISLYVPEGKTKIYQSAGVWQDFYDIQEYDATGIGDLSPDKEPDVIYNLQGQKVTCTKAGQIYIKNGKKVFMK